MLRNNATKNGLELPPHPHPRGKIGILTLKEKLGSISSAVLTVEYKPNQIHLR